MSRVMGIKRLAAGAILAVGLFGVSCNSVGNKPDWAEAVIQGSGLEYTGESIADPKPVIAKITFSVIDRNQSGLSTSDLNNIEFTSVTFTDPLGVSSTSPMGGIFYQVPSTGNILLLDIYDKPASPVAGTSIAFHIHLDGRDNLGRHVEFDIDVATVLTT